MIQDLISQADRSQGIIRNLLDFARESESKIEPLDLGQIIEETVRLAGNQIKISGAHLDVSVLPHLPRIHGDHQQLAQVFLNILLNAIDIIPKGGRIRLSVAQEDPNFLAVKVTDDGPGIPNISYRRSLSLLLRLKPKGRKSGIGPSAPRDCGPPWRADGFSARQGIGTTLTILLLITTIRPWKLTPKTEEHGGFKPANEAMALDHPGTDRYGFFGLFSFYGRHDRHQLWQFLPFERLHAVLRNRRGTEQQPVGDETVRKKLFPLSTGT